MRQSRVFVIHFIDTVLCQLYAQGIILKCSVNTACVGFKKKKDGVYLNEATFFSLRSIGNFEFYSPWS